MHACSNIRSHHKRVCGNFVYACDRLLPHTNDGVKGTGHGAMCRPQITLGVVRSRPLQCHWYRMIVVHFCWYQVDAESAAMRAQRSESIRVVTVEPASYATFSIGPPSVRLGRRHTKPSYQSAFTASAVYPWQHTVYGMHTSCKPCLWLLQPHSWPHATSKEGAPGLNARTCQREDHPPSPPILFVFTDSHHPMIVHVVCSR